MKALILIDSGEQPWKFEVKNDLPMLIQSNLPVDDVIIKVKAVCFKLFYGFASKF